MALESIEEYYAEIARLATEFRSYEKKLEAFAISDFIKTQDEDVINALCAFRKAVLVAEEREQYIELRNIFSDWSEEDAVALVLVSIDLQIAVRIMKSKEIHCKYQDTDPLVKDNGNLRRQERIRDAELVSLSILDEVPGEWFIYKSGFNRLYIDPALDPRIIKLAMMRAPREKIWVRLLPSPPDFVSGQANPKHIWHCELPTRVDGSGEVVADNLVEKAFGVIKLQWAGRYQANRKYFSLSVEQLVRPSPAEPWCYGLMIHLDGCSDTREIGPDKPLKHLDLAINYYEGISACERLEQGHDLLKKTDASYRIHLFRVEGLEFYCLTLLAQIFLPGTCNLFTWLKRRSYLGELPAGPD